MDQKLKMNFWGGEIFLMYHKYKNSQNVVIVNGDQKLRYRMCICMLWFEVICKLDNFLYIA